MTENFGADLGIGDVMELSDGEDTGMNKGGGQPGQQAGQPLGERIIKDNQSFFSWPCF